MSNWINWMSPEWGQVIVTVLLVVITAIYVRINYKLLQENKEQRRALVRPVVLFTHIEPELQPHPEDRSVFGIVNGGAGPAVDVRVTIEPRSIHPIEMEDPRPFSLAAGEHLDRFIVKSSDKAVAARLGVQEANEKYLRTNPRSLPFGVLVASYNNIFGDTFCSCCELRYGSLPKLVRFGRAAVREGGQCADVCRGE